MSRGDAKGAKALDRVAVFDPRKVRADEAAPLLDVAFLGYLDEETEYFRQLEDGLLGLRPRRCWPRCGFWSDDSQAAGHLCQNLRGALQFRPFVRGGDDGAQPRLAFRDGGIAHRRGINAGFE